MKLCSFLNIFKLTWFLINITQVQVLFNEMSKKYYFCNLALNCMFFYFTVTPFYGYKEHIVVAP